MLFCAFFVFYFPVVGCQSRGLFLSLTSPTRLLFFAPLQSRTVIRDQPFRLEPLSHDGDSCSFLLRCAGMKDRRMRIIRTRQEKPSANHPGSTRHQVPARTTLDSNLDPWLVANLSMVVQMSNNK